MSATYGITISKVLYKPLLFAPCVSVTWGLMRKALQSTETQGRKGEIGDRAQEKEKELRGLPFQAHVFE